MGAGFRIGNGAIAMEVEGRSGGTAFPVGRRLAVRVAEAAAMLAVSRSQMYELLRRGQIPSIRVGQRVRVPLEALEEWVRRQAGGAEKGGKADGTQGAR